jgi:hypothetical protein
MKGESVSMQQRQLTAFTIGLRDNRHVESDWISSDSVGWVVRNSGSQVRSDWIGDFDITWNDG